MEKIKYCLCGLALGKKYRDYAVNLATDLQRYHPGVEYFILTDDISDFRGLTNTIPIKHNQDSIVYPFHDRRFIIEKALSQYEVTMQIDTDIKLLKPLIFPNDLDQFKGIICRTENLKSHLITYQPHTIPHYQKVSEKLGIDLESAFYVGEFLFSVSRDQGKEEEFIHYWDMIGRYVELKGIHLADGPVIGLAAAKAGLCIQHSDWPSLIEKEFVEHFKLSSGSKKLAKNLGQKVEYRLKYNYRLNLARLKSLKNLEFYYS